MKVAMHFDSATLSYVTINTATTTTTNNMRFIYSNSFPKLKCIFKSLHHNKINKSKVQIVTDVNCQMSY